MTAPAARLAPPVRSQRAATAGDDRRGPRLRLLTRPARLRASFLGVIVALIGASTLGCAVSDPAVAKPSAEPRAEPSAEPRAEPSAEPRAGPSAEPRAGPSAEPRAGPSAEPRAEPSAELPTIAPETAGFSSDRLALIDSYIARQLANGRLPGVSVLLMRHGKVVLQKAYGQANLDTGTPLKLDNIFRIYSQTKPVTAVAMMILFEQGKWHFDDPITRFIPEFKQLRVFKSLGPDGAIQTEPQSRPPTMRELLTHAAGFAYGLDRSSPVETLWHQADFMRAANTDAAIKQIAALPMYDQPGEHWHYSAAVDIQGYIIERLSGQTLADFMQTHIFGPLRMSDTAFYVPAQKMRRFVGMKQIDSKPLRLVQPDDILNFDFSKPPKIASGGAGLVSTLHDYARFAQMLLNGGELDGVRILSPSAVKLIDSNQLADDIRARQEAFAQRSGVGFGVNVSVTLDPAKAGTLTGPGSFGWGGAAGTNFWVDPTNDIVFVSLMQVLKKWDDPDLKNFDNDLTTLVYAALLHPEK